MMTVFGYVRVSSSDQNEGRQLEKMNAKGVAARNLFVDKASGKDFDRPEYKVLRRALQEGDLVYIDALDRLGRNYDEVISEWKYITRELGADIVVLENEALFDSRKFRDMGDMGKLMEDQFLSLLAYVADQERKKIRQRQREGIALAKQQGKHLGRPVEELTDEQRKTWREVYPRWKDGQVKAVEFMRLLDVKKTKFYRLVKEYEAEKQSTK
ncbi:recombinase family protein [Bacillus badius]|uniref:recombinase family protein n=1 Tax=Bacillus badius TaxID=1455 RepID=UPI001CBDB713|nr:recombinase family protein [Bacillus badius]UAT30036.1 recombinase family protein [Bacillus badius]